MIALVFNSHAAVGMGILNQHPRDQARCDGEEGDTRIQCPKRHGSAFESHGVQTGNDGLHDR